MDYRNRLLLACLIGLSLSVAACGQGAVGTETHDATELDALFDSARPDVGVEDVAVDVAMDIAVDAVVDADVAVDAVVDADVAVDAVVDADVATDAVVDADVAVDAMVDADAVGDVAEDVVADVEDDADVSCEDSDDDSVCDADDLCPGGDDIGDTDGDGVVDGCDACPHDNPDDLDGDGFCGDLYGECRALFTAAPTWGDAAAEAGLDGDIEWGQTHVVGEDETRIAPRMIQQRDTLVLFTPASALDTAVPLTIAAFSGETLVGVLRMAPPSELPDALEQQLTAVELEPYSTDAWSAVVPSDWVSNGNVIRIGYLDGTTRFVRDEPIVGFGAPHRFTVTRTRIVLFGDPDFNTDTTTPEKLARDFFASVPFAELRVVDSLPWRLSEIVVPTATGPQLVGSEAERIAVASDTDHWSIIKHQLALRLSLANTGRGLALTVDSEGDSSPYSFGTSVGMGWFRRPDGTYQDIDDAPWAAGWTGWTAMWADECGNGFIHEVGHSFTLAHFTAGTAASWGIAEEYPSDGTNVESHPWGFDTGRGLFRTWYRVDASGPVPDGLGGLVGKRDPMNGGESPNAATCYPQYTAYHARKVQRWAQDAPTLLELDGVPGAWIWNEASNGYLPAAVDARFQHPVAVDVPVLTMIGTLAATDAASQTYPEIRIASGNVFDLPDPFTPGLHGVFADARWFVEVEYADGALDHALIARGAITNTSLFLYSLNLDARLEPVVVRLYRSPTGYPAIDRAGSTLVHERIIGAPESALPPVVVIGRGNAAAGTLRLGERCEAAYNCAQRDDEAWWSSGDETLTFGDAVSVTPHVCGTHGDHSVFGVPGASDAGARDTLVVYAQRVIRGSDGEVSVPVDDATPWIAGSAVSQGLRVWLPWDENAGLSAGRWSTVTDFAFGVHEGPVPHGGVPIEIDLEVLASDLVDLATTYRSTPIATVGTSMYFVVRDAAIGPTTRVWWDDGVAGATLLRVPVVDTATGVLTTLVLDAQREECSGSRADFNAGRGASNCNHWAVLSVNSSLNAHLAAGHTYRTPSSAPLVFEGRQWHDPGAHTLLGTFALDLVYTR